MTSRVMVLGVVAIMLAAAACDRGSDSGAAGPTWTMSVNATQQRQAIPTAGGERRALGVFVRVNLTFENRGARTRTLDGRDLTLTDAGGKTFQAYATDGNLGNAISPGLKGSGWVTFDVPPDARSLRLTAPDRVFFDVGDVAALPSAD